MNNAEQACLIAYQRVVSDMVTIEKKGLCAVCIKHCEKPQHAGCAFEWKGWSDGQK